MAGCYVPECPHPVFETVEVNGQPKFALCEFHWPDFIAGLPTHLTKIIMDSTPLPKETNGKSDEEFARIIGNF